ncbi:MAG: hypothetical protein JWQ72_2619 [Polaromonas sp.]|nr:hypothetical protein [Polaromonas sp.]
MATQQDNSKDGTEPGDRPDSAEHPMAAAPPSLQGNHGSFSNEAPGLVAPSRLNEGDTGSASDKPEAGGQLDFDDGDMVDGGRGRNVRMGGTWAAQGGDSAPLGPPAEIFSSSNLPSDQQDRPEGPSSNGDSA